MPKRIRRWRSPLAGKRKQAEREGEEGPSSPAELERALRGALGKREALRTGGDVNALRLVHDSADGLPGLVFEQFGEVVVMQVHEGRCKLPANRLREAGLLVMESVGARAVYRKDFPKDRSHARQRRLDALRDPKPWMGEKCAPVVEVEEHGARYVVRPYDGFSTGIFLEQRDNRARVRGWSAGKRVLNGFSYTCGFSIAAALGGATETVSVDVSKRYLEWGKDNFAANGLGLDGHWFICDDMLNYWKRAERQERMFDVIVLDPPTFGRSKQSGETFQFRNDLQALLRGAVARLSPGGLILLCSNQRTTVRGALEAGLKTAAGARTFEVVERPALPIDFGGDPDYAKSVVARFG